LIHHSSSFAGINTTATAFKVVISRAPRNAIRCWQTQKHGTPQSQITWNRLSSRSFVHSTGAQNQNGIYRRFEQPGSSNGRGKGQGPWRWWELYRNRLLAGAGAFGAFYWYNLETVELTGRRRFNLLSPEQELAFAEENYRTTLNTYGSKILPKNHPYTVLVDQVLQRLIPYAPISNADWKVHVIQDDENMNAFVLPGGKVFVFTGILPVCTDENGLAAVLGHEIAHVVTHHFAERMSNSFVVLGIILGVSAMLDISGHLPSIFLDLLYSLPNSRTQEAEADNIGLMMMSKACFKPEAAVDLWAQFHKIQKQVPPQFMSTHPTAYNRMEAIRERLPQAQQVYEDGGCSFTHRNASGFRAAWARLSASTPLVGGES